VTRKTIPLKDIVSMQTETINAGNTFWAVLGSTVVLTAIAFLILGSIFISDVNEVVHN
jgi:hypothetical protein